MQNIQSKYVGQRKSEHRREPRLFGNHFDNMKKKKTFIAIEGEIEELQAPISIS